MADEVTSTGVTSAGSSHSARSGAAAVNRARHATAAASATSGATRSAFDSARIRGSDASRSS